MIVFQAVDDALACVAAIQTALAEPAITRRDDKGKDWTVRVRIGVHTARKQVRPDDRVDYTAGDFNFASRVQSLGCGGQVIVSHSAVSAAATASRYHWAHWPNRRLESFSAPELVHELLWRGEGTSLGEPGSRWVPAWFKGERNRYIARPELESRILATFDARDSSGAKCRLVTLHALGGMGKTRLAIACATQAVGFFEGEVFFVSLDDAPQTGDAWMVERIARVLGLSGATATSAGVIQYLEDKLCLLVLDNYESVDSAGARDFIAALHRGTTKARLLVTGREAVRLSDVEHPIRLDDGLTEGESRELFVARACQVKPEWEPTADELKMVDQVVGLLERIPLSIELAAAWRKRKTVREIFGELEKAVLGEITAVGKRDGTSDPAKRHHSMQACLEWSWNLLEPEYHDGFASLSLFADSFDAEAVTGGCGVTNADELLHRLHDAALLRRVERGGDTRYSMLHLVQAFARQKFDVLGDRAPRVQLFVEHYDKLISANDNINDDRQREVLHREWRNGAGAAALAEAGGLWGNVASISGSLNQFLGMRGELAVLEALLHGEIRAGEAINEPQIISRAANSLGIVLRTRGDLDGAEALYRKALAIEEKLGRLEGLASDYGNLGIVLRTRGDLDGAEAMHSKALAIEEKLWRLEGLAYQYGNLGNVLRTRGDLDGADAMYRKALAIDEKLGRLAGMASDYGNLGIVLQTRGDLDGAEAMHRKALAIDEKLGRLEGMATQYGNLGIVLQTRGDLDGAEAMYRKALAIEEKVGRLEGMASDYGNLGVVMKARGDPERAREMWTKARDLFARLGAKAMVEKMQAWLDGLGG